MIKIIVNLNIKVKRVALVSLSLPLGLYGVFLAQPKITSAHNKALKTGRYAPWDLRSYAAPAL